MMRCLCECLWWPRKEKRAEPLPAPPPREMKLPGSDWVTVDEYERRVKPMGTHAKRQLQESALHTAVVTGQMLRTPLEDLHTMLNEHYWEYLDDRKPR